MCCIIGKVIAVAEHGRQQVFYAAYKGALWCLSIVLE